MFLHHVGYMFEGRCDVLCAVAGHAVLHGSV